MTEPETINDFLSGNFYAVVGASADRSKYGNKVLRCYQQNGHNVVAVNPGQTSIEGVQSFPTLSDVPDTIHGISIITPPDVTEQIVGEAVEQGIKYIWIQPGAESTTAVQTAEQGGAEVISGGACILVELGFRE